MLPLEASTTYDASLHNGLHLQLNLSTSVSLIRFYCLLDSSSYLITISRNTATALRSTPSDGWPSTLVDTSYDPPWSWRWAFHEDWPESSSLDSICDACRCWIGKPYWIKSFMTSSWPWFSFYKCQLSHSIAVHGRQPMHDLCSRGDVICTIIVHVLWKVRNSKYFDRIAPCSFSIPDFGCSYSFAIFHTSTYLSLSLLDLFEKSLDFLTQHTRPDS